jgi:hypothetical protein
MNIVLCQGGVRKKSLDPQVPFKTIYAESPFLFARTPCLNTCMTFLAWIALNPAHEKQDEKDDHDDANEADATVTIPVPIAAEAATESAEQEDDEYDDEYEPNGHGGIPSCMCEMRVRTPTTATTCRDSLLRLPLAERRFL